MRYRLLIISPGKYGIVLVARSRSFVPGNNT
jgi:hypothetical protein